jgi:hypothetical protein
LITFNNITADILKTVTTLIEKCGGIIPVIMTLAGIFSKTLFPMITMGFKTIGNKIAVWTGKAANDVAKM